MNSDNHIIIVLPFGNQVPTQEEILNRFKNLYAEHKPLMPLLTVCAEEAERIMHELFVGKRTVVVKIKTVQGRNNYTKATGYFCPSCKQNGVHVKYKYCPYCGKPIMWI